MSNLRNRLANMNKKSEVDLKEMDKLIGGINGAAFEVLKEFKSETSQTLPIGFHFEVMEETKDGKFEIHSGQSGKDFISKENLIKNCKYLY